MASPGHVRTLSPSLTCPVGGIFSPRPFAVPPLPLPVGGGPWPRPGLVPVCPPPALLGAGPVRHSAPWLGGPAAAVLVRLTRPESLPRGCEEVGRRTEITRDWPAQYALASRTCLAVGGACVGRVAPDGWSAAAGSVQFQGPLLLYLGRRLSLGRSWPSSLGALPVARHATPQLCTPESLLRAPLRCLHHPPLVATSSLGAARWELCSELLVRELPPDLGFASRRVATVVAPALVGSAQFWLR